MDLPTPQDLRERRTSLELTQSELAERAEVSQPLIARIEGGDVDPRLSTLRRIVNALEATEGGIPRARDLMNDEVVRVAPDASVHEAQQRMDDHGYSQVPVVQDGTPKGLIGHSDIRQRSGENVGELPVEHVMHEDFVTVEPEEPIGDFEGSLDYNDAVLVVENGRTVGIITEADVARYLS